MSKIRSTDQLLTLGMALTTDRRAMERRVRGVFARKRSAKGVLALSAVLALALGFAAFTTACQPEAGGAGAHADSGRGDDRRFEQACFRRERSRSRCSDGYFRSLYETKGDGLAKILV